MNLDAYIQYFEAIAINHVDLGHSPTSKRFFRVDLFSLENHIHRDADVPLLALENPYLDTLNDNVTNARWTYHCALLILDRVHDRKDHQKLSEAERTCFRICEDIEAKIRKDRKQYTNGSFTIEGLNHSSFSIELVPRDFGMFTGARLSFQINSPKRSFDIHRWNNETDYLP